MNLEVASAMVDLFDATHQTIDDGPMLARILKRSKPPLGLGGRGSAKGKEDGSDGASASAAMPQAIASLKENPLQCGTDRIR